MLMPATCWGAPARTSGIPGLPLLNMASVVSTIIDINKLDYMGYFESHSPLKLGLVGQHPCCIFKQSNIICTNHFIDDTE